MSKRLGIIQSRGLGDILIALPIANHYRAQGWDIYWPIAQQFLPNVEKHVPWVHWIPLIVDRGTYFYDIPMQRLRNLGCEEILCLYQSLSGHPEITGTIEFQIMKFDQFKYHIAQIDFVNKWRLSECIQRDPDEEKRLYDQLGAGDQPYCVLHLEGSNHTAAFDRSVIPPEYKVIEIREQVTKSIFSWLQILEGADIIVCVDSVVANMVDQFNMTRDKDCYLIPRSHIQLTPVFGGQWTYLDPAPQIAQRLRLFVPS